MNKLKLLSCLITGLFLVGVCTSIGLTKVEISYWTHTYETAVSLNKIMIEEFMQQNPEIKVSYDHFPHANYEPKLLTAFAGGAGPDVFWAGDWLMSKWIPMGMLEPVDYTVWGVGSYKEFIDLFEPGALNAYIMNGKVYTAGTSEYNTCSVFYNPEHFREVGIPFPSKTEPVTWEEFAQILGKLTKFDPTGKRVRSGIENFYSVPIWAVLTLEPQVRQLGGEIVKEGQPQFTSAECVKALNWWYELKRKKIIDPAFVVGLFDDFADGRISTLIAGPWFISSIRQINPKMEFDTMPLPVFEGGERVTTLYSWAWFVSSFSQNKEAAWKLAHYVSTQPSRWWDKVRYPPAIKGTFSTLVEKEPLLTTFKEDYKYGEYEFRSENYYKLSDILMKAWQRVVMEDMEPEEALKKAQEEAEKL